MKKYNRSGSSLFLMEIILNIFLFSILLTVSLQIIMKAHTLTAETSQLHRAVAICSSIATCFENGDGSVDSICRYYPRGISTGDLVLLYFDENFTACAKENAIYVASVSTRSDDDKEAAGDTSPYDSRLTLATISFMEGSDVIYTVTACHYEPLTVYTQPGGTSYE